jgi:cyclase
MSAALLYDQRGVDEMILLDIDATPSGRGPRFEEIRQFTSKIFCPLSVGGGVRTLDDIRGLLKVGADKVIIRSHARSPFLREAAFKFGAQCITVAIDYRTVHGRMSLPMAQALVEDGIGEIILTNTDRDGTRAGYDLATLRKVCAAVPIPVVANGGCQSPDDMVRAIEAGAHAVAASTMFLYDNVTPNDCKLRLERAGIPVRIEA